MHFRCEKLYPPVTFDFPFKPYNIQHEFMTALYNVIENKEIGIFESPTGTGKSLSLMCGSLKWLTDQDYLYKKELNDKIIALENEIKTLELENEKINDWITGQYGTIEKKNILCQLKVRLDLVLSYEKNLNDIHNKCAEKKEKRKKYFNNKSETVDASGLDPEESADNNNFLIEDNENSDNEDTELDEEEKDTYFNLKIFLASRTHSQLAQIVNEIKSTAYGKLTRVVSLASRQNYCINPSVKKLNSNALINEACLDLQKNRGRPTSVGIDGKLKKKSKTSTGCPYYSQSHITNLKDLALSEILDIEDLVSTGETLKACPYYAARLAAKNAQVVLLPYQMLFHQQTRLLTGIDIKENIVIVDEAHNLLDTISVIYSTEVNFDQIQDAYKQLNAYKTKYLNRFSTKNLLKLNQLIFITKRLISILDNKDCKKVSRMVSTQELVSEGEFSNLNLFVILSFCDKTRLAQKVHGFSQHNDWETNVNAGRNERDKETSTKSFLNKLSVKHQVDKNKLKINKTEVVIPKEESSVNNIEVKNRSSIIRPLLAFLQCLTDKCTDGRVLLTYNNDLTNTTQKTSMKYLLLNPAAHFEAFLTDCRSLIVAGGTMQPTSELTEQLFKNERHRVREYFYSHVVDINAVLPLAVSKGPRNKNLLFNFLNRNNEDLLLELSLTLQNICQVVPAGVVCFFSSYDYLEIFYKYLMKTKDILNKIENKKIIFKEPRSGGGQALDKLLLEYNLVIKTNKSKGALLLSVIGGKLSEGINFSDDLGRCIIVVGLPYPNKNNPELIEKMAYLNTNLNQGGIKQENFGQQYYENLCMKAVNQCIGRAVRHINDYASVILLDERYSQNKKIQQKLPTWISRALKIPLNFGQTQSALGKYFRDKKENN